MELYMKNSAGEFVPIAIEHVVDPKEWSGKLVVVKLGDVERPATAADEEAFIQVLEDSHAVMYNAVDASIVVGTHKVTFEIKEKCDE